MIKVFYNHQLIGLHPNDSEVLRVEEEAFITEKDGSVFRYKYCDAAGIDIACGFSKPDSNCNNCNQ